MGVKDHKDLTIWKKGIDIADYIYKITKSFPREELYGLTTQMRRSAVSVPSNIAEGFARQGSREYRQFLYHALGSCAEIETQIMIGLNQGYVTKETYEAVAELIDHESRMLMNMIKSITRSMRND